MKVKSTIQCGYRPHGEVLLQVGLNDLDDRTLSEGERIFIDALAKEKLVEILDEAPRVPESGTKLVQVQVDPLPEVDDDFEPLPEAVAVAISAPATAASGRRKRR